MALFVNSLEYIDFIFKKNLGGRGEAGVKLELFLALPPEYGGALHHLRGEY